MEFTKQEMTLIHELVGLAWQVGAVKSPQMAQVMEQLRVKVAIELEPQKPIEQK